MAEELAAETTQRERAGERLGWAQLDAAAWTTAEMCTQRSLCPTTPRGTTRNQRPVTVHSGRHEKKKEEKKPKPTSLFLSQQLTKQHPTATGCKQDQSGE
jgi:hypothetical protein